jgi:hypothetical protein
MPDMNIVTGLSGLKAAAELIRTLRDGLKSGQMKPDEIAGRIGEIYDYIVDSKDALIDAKDEIVRLQEEISNLKNVSDNFELRDNVYWRKGTKDAYCPLCMGATGKAVPLQFTGRTGWYCGIHNKWFEPPASPEWTGIEIFR